jgi:capsular exopolysaccharide synthesis family protein
LPYRWHGIAAALDLLCSLISPRPDYEKRSQTLLPNPRDTFLNGDDAESVLGVPAIGFFPTITDELRLIREIDGFHPLVEGYRSLRTNLRFVTDPQKPLSSLLIASAAPGEGKSTITANLAMAMAMDSKQVIVVDADLRRPSQHKLFNVEPSPGLTDVLKGTHTLKDVLRPTAVANVSVSPCGTVPANPAELLGSKEMTRLLTEVENISDIVLLDSAPMLAVCDSMLVASQVSGVLLVINHGETKQLHLCDTMKLLARARATVVGTVLNRLPGGVNYYYYYSPSPAPDKGADIAADVAPD